MTGCGPHPLSLSFSLFSLYFTTKNNAEVRFVHCNCFALPNFVML